MFKSILLIVAVCIAIIAVVGVLYYNYHPTFGVKSTGERLAKMQRSPYYKDGLFHNIEETNTLTTDKTKLELFWDNLVKPKANNLIPKNNIPVVKTDLKALDINEDLIIWLGHSSYFIQIDGKRILIDPIFNSNASPLPVGNDVFKGTNFYAIDDIPNIDYVLITHDHYDHLDYPTLKKLKGKVKEIVVPLGLGDTMVSWGYSDKSVKDLDWFEKIVADNDSLSITFAPSRHYSARRMARFENLWGSYIIKGSKKNLYFSGDSGYGKHFKMIGEQYGPFDFVSLDSGQYNEKWKYIHMRPEQALQAAVDLKTSYYLPAHIGRFALAQHDWREPFEIIEAEMSKYDVQIIIRKIGTPIDINHPKAEIDKWWKINE
jgi:L-ascorbate metabolism protein UlaG (beta-lactamase superfamily)